MRVTYNRLRLFCLLKTIQHIPYILWMESRIAWQQIRKFYFTLINETVTAWENNPNIKWR